MTQSELKAFFGCPFKGMENLLENLLSPIFGEFEAIKYPKYNDYEPQYGNDGANIKHIYDYGNYSVEGAPVSVWEVELADNCHISRARKNVQEMVRKLMGNYTGAFVVFHYGEKSTNADKDTWRLSWVKRLDKNSATTTAKRYTYLCGPGYSCRTIAERFEKLKAEGNKTLDTVTKAFDAEALSDEFFAEYKVLYDDIVQWITGQRIVKRDNAWKTDGVLGSAPDKNGIYPAFKELFDNDDEKATKAVRDYVKKLMGRLVFIQFLQKKGYLGINGRMSTNFLMDLFNGISEEKQEDFIETALEQVVYLLLNNETRDKGKDHIDGLLLNVPFLNGGLFEPDTFDTINVRLPKEFFHNEQYGDEKRAFGITALRPADKMLTQCGILDLFNHYNFTIDENDPDDAELGVDPEMLGKIFENLLEDNKDKGAFYTPKEIVQYMCQESLIAYLQTGIDDEEVKEDIRRFVTTQEMGKKLPKDIDQKLQEVKICDPAIGSGAFPMGLLNLLVALREKLEPAINRCKLKKEIIQNNIYGVDIERGAIDIARLRFWLSIMVDEEVDENNPKPTPLPNFDYKFMQGNSLLEQYKGIDLSTLSSGEKVSMQTDIFQNNLKQFQSQLHSLIELYYNTDNHVEKKKLKKEIQDNVNNQMKASGVSVDFTEIGIDVAGNNQFFLWHTWFQDVFDNGMFDIVIGNPPYVRQERLGMEYKNLLISSYPDVGNGIADLYVYFFGLGIKILKQNGILSFITLNKYLKTKYGRELRNTLSKSVSVDRIIDFFELPVFNASTDSAITVLYNSKSTIPTRYFPIKTLDNLDLTAITQGKYLSVIKNESEWQFVKPIQMSILEKIVDDSISLKEFTSDKIYYGVKTGFNKAFIIKDKSLANELLSSECAPIIKRYAQPTDIKKWNIENKDKFYLVGTFPALNLNIEKYPTLKNYLSSFDVRRLEQSGKKYTIDGVEVSARKKTNNKWYETQDTIAYYDFFNQPKIIYIHTAKNHQFFFDTEGYFVNNSCYFIVSSSKFLFCFLNSRLFRYFKQIKFVAYGDGQEAGRCKLDYNKMITVPIRKDVDEAPFEQIVNTINSILKQNPSADISKFENEIERMIYTLYNLTYDEVVIIYGNEKPPFSREEYEKEKNKHPSI